MTDEELAAFKMSLAKELSESVGDHMKLLSIMERLRGEAMLLRDPDADISRPAMESGQQAAERPGVRLADDPNAPQHLPVIGESVVPPVPEPYVATNPGPLTTDDDEIDRNAGATKKDDE